MKAARFEELIAWQKARLLVTEIYRVTAGQEFARDFALQSQMRRAAVSIMSNIAEGFERARRAEFHHFVIIAKASCAEVRSQLYVAHDVGYLPDSALEALLAQAEELGRILGGLRGSLEKK